MVDTEESRFRSKETLIRVDKPIAEQLRALGKKGESYSDVVQRLLSKAQINVPVESELYGFLLQLVQGTGKGAKVVDVSSTIGQTFAKLGAVSGFRGENFRDWGVQETAKATMITFLGIDDRYTLLSTVMTQTMSTLIDEFGTTELEPILEQTLEASAAAFARMFPEGEG